MKFTATLAAIATSVSAINLADADDSMTSGAPIVPLVYEDAVHAFDMNAAFTDQATYEKNVDIYSD